MEYKGNELAYLAGILDGDGSFSLIKTSSNTSKSPLYYPLIQLANTSKSLIDHFLNYGGTSIVRESYIAKDGRRRKKCYQWKISGRARCLSFLELVIPYLVIKKERAMFLRDYIINNEPRHGGIVLTNEQLFSREKTYLGMRKFNEVPLKVKLPSLKNIELSLDESFWSYVAGIIDSDGSLSIKKEIRKTRKNPSYTPVILISMIDPRSVYYIGQNVPGSNILMIKAKTTVTGFMYRFSISSKSVAETFLKKCMDYLLIKKDQARILLDFCENSISTQYRQGGIDSGELEYRENCYNKIVQLNEYGVVKSSLMDLKPLTDNAEGNKGQAAKAGSLNVASEKTSKDDAVL